MTADKKDKALELVREHLFSKITSYLQCWHYGWRYIPGKDEGIIVWPEQCILCADDSEQGFEIVVRRLHEKKRNVKEADDADTGQNR